jgi:hypothetical protein
MAERPASPLSWILLAIAAVVIMQFGTSKTPQPDDTKPEPEPTPIVDKSADAFQDYERLWRVAQGELARKLRSGDIKTEPQATEWFGRANNEALKAAFTPLVEAEHERFGGEKWTAEQHAKQAEEYAGGT